MVKHLGGLSLIRRGAGLVMMVVMVGTLAACGKRPVQQTQAAAATAVQPTAVTVSATETAVPGVIQAAAVQASQTTAAAQKTATAPADTAAPADARQAVIAALHAVMTAGPYHIKSTTTGQKNITMSGDVILPDRFHLTTDGQEMLIIGEKTYMKQNGQWVDFPVDIGGAISGMVGTMTSQTEQSISDAVMLGSDTVNGTPTTLYQFHLGLDAGGNTISSTVKLWVDSLRGLPVQQQIDGDVGGIKSSTLQVITYDASITIPQP